MIWMVALNIMVNETLLNILVFFSLPNFPLFREEMIRLDGSNYESAHKHIDIVGCLKFPFCI